MRRKIPANQYTMTYKGWREIAPNKKFYFRSRWESNYARYLEYLLLSGEISWWSFEEDVFWFLKIKRGVRSYLPDFKITQLDGTIVYHELKGYLDSKSKTKLNRMRIYHPNVKIELVESKKYKEIEKQYKSLIKDWE